MFFVDLKNQYLSMDVYFGGFFEIFKSNNGESFNIIELLPCPPFILNTA